MRERSRTIVVTVEDQTTVSRFFAFAFEQLQDVLADGHDAIGGIQGVVFQTAVFMLGTGTSFQVLVVNDLFPRVAIVGNPRFACFSGKGLTD